MHVKNMHPENVDHTRTHRSILSQFVNPNQIWIIIRYHFPVDLAPNGIQFGAKSIGKW